MAAKKVHQLDGDIEHRTIAAEMRVDGEGTIEGYAAVFNVFSEPILWFKEKIRTGAFAKTIKEADVRALFNHDPNYVLGRNTAQTLELSEDKHGLQFRVKPPQAQWARDLQESVQRGDINQASFGFSVVREEWKHTEEPNKLDERELVEVRLYDVSVVTFPAYPQTSVSARSLAEMFIAQIKANSDPETVEYLRSQLGRLETFAPEHELHPEGTEENREHERLDLPKLGLEVMRLR